MQSPVDKGPKVVSSACGDMGGHSCGAAPVYPHLHMRPLEQDLHEVVVSTGNYTSETAFVTRCGTAEPSRFLGSKVLECCPAQLFLYRHMRAATTQSVKRHQDAYTHTVPEQQQNSAGHTRLSAPSRVRHLGRAKTAPGHGTASSACWACTNHAPD